MLRYVTLIKIDTIIGLFETKCDVYHTFVYFHSANLWFTFLHFYVMLFYKFAAQTFMFYCFNCCTHPNIFQKESSFEIDQIRYNVKKFTIRNNMNSYGYSMLSYIRLHMVMLCQWHFGLKFHSYSCWKTRRTNLMINNLFDKNRRHLNSLT